MTDWDLAEPFPPRRVRGIRAFKPDPRIIRRSRSDRAHDEQHSTERSIFQVQSFGDRTFEGGTMQQGDEDIHGEEVGANEGRD
jgi:hypothetical protein